MKNVLVRSLQYYIGNKLSIIRPAEVTWLLLATLRSNLGEPNDGLGSFHMTEEKGEPVGLVITEIGGRLVRSRDGQQHSG